jgi:hypothetical protein
MHDAADHVSVINPVRTAPTTRQQRFKALPLGVAQPIELLPHQVSLDSEALNHNSSRAGIRIEYGPQASTRVKRSPISKSPEAELN